MMQAPSMLKSVELPHAGMSYNPTLEDHQVATILSYNFAITNSFSRTCSELP